MNRLTAFIKVFILRRKLWLATVLDNGEAHCFPLGDQIRHQLDEDCICGPGATLVTADDDESHWAYKHHSLDGREAHEREWDWT